MYANYAFYVDSYGGTLQKAEFERNLHKAEAYVNNVTQYRINEVTEAIKLCTCAIVEAMVDASCGVKTSESLGGWSVSYAQRKSTDSELYDVASLYLGGSGLLCRWV